MTRIVDDLLEGRRNMTAEERDKNKARTEGMTERHIQRALYWRHRGGSQVMLPNYAPRHWQECDLFVVTKAAYSIEYEAKVTFADFKADFRKLWKHQRLEKAAKERRFVPARFFYAVPELLIRPCDVPEYAGLVYLWFPGNSRVFAKERVVREAPRLTKTKVPDDVIRHMQESSYYRFWSERFKFDDYRAQNGNKANDT